MQQVPLCHCPNYFCSRSLRLRPSGLMRDIGSFDVDNESLNLECDDVEPLGDGITIADRIARDAIVEES